MGLAQRLTDLDKQDVDHKVKFTAQIILMVQDMLRKHDANGDFTEWPLEKIIEIATIDHATNPKGEG